MIDYNDFDNRYKLCQTLRVEMDDFADEYHDDGFRTHLGGSIIGHKCPRYSFYNFRHVARDVPNGMVPDRSRGQMRRLHQRGHREEPWLWFYLKSIGWKIQDKDPETGKQIRVSAHEGHFGGSLDAIGWLPERFQLAEPVLLECKTANDKAFKRIKKDGIKLEKPQHWRQICTYGHLKQINWSLYAVVNKNNDEWYFEFNPIDLGEGELQTRKALQIIQCPGNQPPPKYSMNASDFTCKGCDFVNVCHFGEAPEKNCRSCIHAQASTNKQWFCGHHGTMIQPETLPVGCDKYEGIPSEQLY